MMHKDNLQDYRDVAVAAAERAGELILLNLGRISGKDIDLKQASDFVTRVDKESEALIIDTISSRFPDHRFLAEESPGDQAEAEFRWIIDPLDGTTNYIHSFPVFSVSIGLEHQGRIIVAVVFDPLKKELFTAVKEGGAFLNGAPLRVSGTGDLGRSLVTTGFPFRSKDLIDPYLALFRNIFFRVSDIRRAGSAALDLAYVACGRCEAFFELGLSPWDIAAGGLLIQEAGGTITDFSGNDRFLVTGNVVAGNPLIHDKILREVQAIFSFA